MPMEVIEHRIIFLRGRKVMLGTDLAELYQVPTKALNQAVKRNIDRFPEDFMVKLTQEEASLLRSQIVTLEGGRGKYPKYAPYAFTEQGVAMLSSVLRSERAIHVNIVIMRAFVKLREIMATHKDLAHKIDALEDKYQEHDKELQIVFKAIRELLQPPPMPPRRQIGFIK